MATVDTIMSSNLVTVDPLTPLDEAAREMHSHRIGAVLVMSGDRVSGILTERDVLRAVATGQIEGTNVAAWMTRDPETIEPSDTTSHAAAMMIHGAYRHL